MLVWKEGVEEVWILFEGKKRTCDTLQYICIRVRPPAVSILDFSNDLKIYNNTKDTIVIGDQTKEDVLVMTYCLARYHSWDKNDQKLYEKGKEKIK